MLYDLMVVVYQVRGGLRSIIWIQLPGMQFVIIMDELILRCTIFFSPGITEVTQVYNCDSTDYMIVLILITTAVVVLL